MYIQQHFSEILEVLYPGSGASVQGLNIVSWSTPPTPTPTAEWLIAQLQEQASAEYKKYVAHKLAEYEATTQSALNGFFDALMPPTHQRLYQMQQDDVRYWELSGADAGNLPETVVYEWENDKSQRALDESGAVLVSAAGLKFKCRSALDLFNTWRLNTWFIKWLQGRGKTARSFTDYQIADFAPTGDDPLGDWVANANVKMGALQVTLAGLPMQYATTVLPGKLALVGLDPAA